MIGTTVGKKPDKPGKPEEPSHDLVPADFEIWIGGEGTQDISLNPPGSSLLVEDVVGGYWLPRTKGNAPREGWSVILPQGGTYIIDDDEGLPEILASHGIGSETEAYYFYILHDHENNRNWGEGDYWLIAIVWQVGWLEPIPNPGGDPDPITLPHLYRLSGYTNKDASWEGVYNEITDTWTVTFNNAEFELSENVAEMPDPETGYVYVKLWEGQLSFTVEVQRILP